MCQFYLAQEAITFKELKVKKQNNLTKSILTDEDSELILVCSHLPAETG